MVSGAAAAASLTALATPVSGEWTSSAVLVDSGSPQASPATTSLPTVGSSTRTTSPRSAAAAAVMPMRAVAPPSPERTHSCSPPRRSPAGNCAMSSPLGEREGLRLLARHRGTERAGQHPA